MSALNDLEKRFLGHVRGGAVFPRDLCAQGLVDSDVGLSIYTDAYSSRLAEALEADHPLLGLYLGDVLWAEFCNGYIESHPSQVRSLRHFGAHGPAWLASRAPFSKHPVIAELATFERTLLDAFDAAEGERLDWSNMQSMAPESWPSLRLRFHPSVRLLPMTTNAVEIWRALKDASPAPKSAASTLPARLIWRDEERISRFRPIEDAELTALQTVFSRQESFAEMCEQLSRVCASEEVPAMAIGFLRRWFDDGIMSQLLIATD